MCVFSKSLFRAYRVLRTVPGAGSATVSETDWNPCLQEACALVEETDRKTGKSAASHVRMRAAEIGKVGKVHREPQVSPWEFWSRQPRWEVQVVNRPGGPEGGRRSPGKGQPGPQD